MGNARWDTNTYRTYASSTSLSSLSIAETFTARAVKETLDPTKMKDLGVRESRDSESNPNSIPIILALDVTGSMGKYAAQIAKENLPELMEKLMQDLDPFADPHIMFMGVGDAHCDRSPLQVSQFEADLRILETLRDMWLEGGGGGNSFESYDLPWYFAAYKTSTDSFEKRGKKGYLFTFGDEMPPLTPTTPALLKKVFGEGEYPNLTTSELLAKAQEKYQVFHVVIEQGSHCSMKSSHAKVRSAWTELLGPNVLFLKDSNDLTSLILATLKIAEGQVMADVIEASEKKEALEYAFSNTLQTA